MQKGEGSPEPAGRPAGFLSPVQYAQAPSDSQTDVPSGEQEDQQLAQAAPAAARLLQWGIPAAIAAGQAGRNLLEEWWKKPSEPPPPQPLQPPSPPQPVEVPIKLENPVLEDTLREAMSRPLENSRGDVTTQRGNDILVDECSKLIKAEFPELGDHLKHVGGATKKGLGEEKVTEEVINGPRGKWLGGSRPDITFEFGDDPNERYRINTTSMTTSMRGDRMTSREQASFDNLKRNLGNDLVGSVPKLRPGMDEAEYRTKVRETCREIAGRWSDHLGEQGKLPAKGRAPQSME